MTVYRNLPYFEISLFRSSSCGQLLFLSTGYQQVFSNGLIFCLMLGITCVISGGRLVTTLYSVISQLRSGNYSAILI